MNQGAPLIQKPFESWAKMEGANNQLCEKFYNNLKFSITTVQKL